MNPPLEIALKRTAYEEFVYTLPTRYSALQSSTLVVKMISSQLAEVIGTLFFAGEVRLEVTEAINFAEQRITAYGYEVWRGAEKLYWYDSQPHPYDATLASTHPHHKHLPPDIKHHRVPAPGLSFTQPNLPFLIEEILVDVVT